MIKPVFIERYKNIVVLTGAGISVASGLRTYRGPNGMWEEGDTARVSHIDILDEEPELVWKFFGPLKDAINKTEPNAAHFALAALEQKLQPEQKLTLVTQNIDCLHTRAGSKNVIELHGSLFRSRCSNRSCKLQVHADNVAHSGTPTCSECSSLLRPDIVFFGEEIPLDAMWAVRQALRSVDLFIAIGTSGTVSPASSFVSSAKYMEARTILVNLEAMVPRNAYFDEEVLGKAEEMLPLLLGVAEQH